MDKVSIYYQNCRGLRTKLNTLYANILSECYDIIILSETWLVPQISDDEFIDSRYSVFRCDRDRQATGKMDGGGVLVGIRRELQASRYSLSDKTNDLLMPTVVDCVLLKVASSKCGKQHLICGLYIPPNQACATYQAFFDSLQDLILCDPIDSYCFVGDFNLPHLNWKNSDGLHLEPSLSSSNTLTEKYFVNFLYVIGGMQYNRLCNHNGRHLDLLITNIDSCILEPPMTPLVPIDSLHPPFYATLTYALPCKPMPRTSPPGFSFIKGDYVSINNDINNIDWDFVLGNLPIENAVSIFYERMYEIIKKYVPQRMCKPIEFPIWFSRPLIHVFRNKEKAWVKWKKYGNMIDYMEFSEFRYRFKVMSKECYSKYIQTIESSLRKDVGTFWKFVNSRKSKSGIPSIMNYSDVKSDDPNTICDLFSRFFGSVYESGSAIDFDIENVSTITNTNGDLVSDIYISLSDIVRELKQLDVTKGPGPDGLPPIFLKLTAESISKPIFLLYRLSLHKGEIPLIWKTANVTPVFKSGSKNDVTNYRPISLLSVLSKVLERLVHNIVYPIVHRIVIPSQHGFVRNRSCITNLLLYTNFLFERMDACEQVDAVYTDFCKAFDKVDHLLLLQKLAFNGIKGNLLRWFTSYVRNRTQRVVINGFASNSISVTSGVPQGSILGPLLFIIFINDIGSCFHNSHYLLYADDLKVYQNITTFNDCIDLQDDLNRLSEYCNKNKLHLSLSKCKTITFTKKLNVIKYQYKLCSATLEQVSVIKDLGILFDSKLHFEDHINYITNKSFQLYGFVMRTSVCFKRPQSFLLLFKSLIRSQLEYATSIWNPFYSKYSDRLETVQRKFLRTVEYKCYHRRLSYDNLLSKYSVQSLFKRRLLLDQLTLYNICHHKFDCTEIINQIKYRVPLRLGRSCNIITFRLFKPKFVRTHAGKRAPLRRIMQSYNKHFVNVDLFALSPSKFKKNICELLKTV